MVTHRKVFALEGSDCHAVKNTHPGEVHPSHSATNMQTENRGLWESEPLSSAGPAPLVLFSPFVCSVNHCWPPATCNPMRMTMRSLLRVIDLAFSQPFHRCQTTIPLVIPANLRKKTLCSEQKAFSFHLALMSGRLWRTLSGALAAWISIFRTTFTQLFLGFFVLDVKSLCCFIL